MDSEDYYTRIEDLPEELPDKVLNELNNLDYEDDSVSDIVVPPYFSRQKISYSSIILDALVVFLIVLLMVNKRFVKWINDSNTFIPKNILFSIISSVLFVIYKLIYINY